MNIYEAWWREIAEWLHYVNNKVKNQKSYDKWALLKGKLEQKGESSFQHLLISIWLFYQEQKLYVKHRLKERVLSN